MVSRTSKAPDLARTIAHSRSLEAELATEQVSTDPGVDANQHAAQLHTEAAKWRRQVGDQPRALVHDAYATVHARLVARLQPDGEEER